MSMKKLSTFLIENKLGPVVETFIDGREAAKKKVGIWSPSEAQKNLGKLVDYYHPSNGDKHQGTITNVTSDHHTIKDSKTGKLHKFVHAGTPMAKRTLAEEIEPVEEISADLKKRLELSKRLNTETQPRVDAAVKNKEAKQAAHADGQLGRALHAFRKSLDTDTRVGVDSILKKGGLGHKIKEAVARINEAKDK